MVVIILILSIFTIIEVEILDYLRIFGVKPDLLLITVLFFALYRRAKWAGFTGILAGLLRDVFTVNPFGISILYFGFLGKIGSFLGRYIFYKRRYLIQMSVTFLSMLIYSFICGFFQAGVRNDRSFRLILISSSLYTTLVSPGIFWLSGRIVDDPSG